MGAVDWAQASIHSSRLRDVARPPKGVALVAPTRIEVDDVRWHAVRTVPKCERRVARDLAESGIRAYCPLGAKMGFWRDGKKNGRRAFVRQFPVFSGYIFAGVARGQHLGRSSVEKIAAILGDACGPLTIPARAIRTLNELELAFHWDETRSWREKSPFQRGSPIRITDGAYASFTATVDALVSETRIRVLVSMFGRLAPVELDIEAIETI